MSDEQYEADNDAWWNGLSEQAMLDVNRIEVIDGTGRICVKYLDKDEQASYNLQDDNRTLKIFINSATSY